MAERTNLGDIVNLIANVGQVAFPNSRAARVGGVVGNFFAQQVDQRDEEEKIRKGANVLGLDPRMVPYLDRDDIANLYMMGERQDAADRIAQNRYGDSISAFMRDPRSEPYREMLRGLPPQDQAKVINQIMRLDVQSEKERGMSLFNEEVQQRGRLRQQEITRENDINRTNLDLREHDYKEGVPSTPDAAPSGEWQSGGTSRDAPSWAPQSNRLMNDIIRQGYSPSVAAGIAGNAHQESGVRTNPPGSNDGGASGGMFQWNGERLRALKADAERKGVPWDSWEHQVDFMLRSPDDPQSRETLARLKANPDLTPEQASDIFRGGFERPSANDAASRRSFAAQAHRAFTPSEGGDWQDAGTSEEAPSWLQEQGSASGALSNHLASGNLAAALAQDDDDDDAFTARSRAKRTTTSSSSGTSSGGGLGSAMSPPSPATGQSPSIPTPRDAVVPGKGGRGIGPVAPKTEVRRRRKKVGRRGRS